MTTRLLALALVLLFATPPRAAAPDFTLQSLDGPSSSLHQYRGRIVVVNFWATWCPPCRKEIPWLMELQRTFPGQLVVLGVAMDEEGRRVVDPWVRRERFPLAGVQRAITYPVLLGTDHVAEAYQVESLPATFLVGVDGAEVRRIDGPFDLASLERSVRALIHKR